MLRFIHNTRSRNSRKIGELTALEIRDARLSAIRITQQVAYHDEILDLQRGRPIPSSSSIISLNPKLDNGVLCIGSRLEHASIALDSKYPIILPSNARITALLIADFHEKFAHSSTDRTLHEIRKLYWIPRGRQVIRKIVKR